MIVKRHLSNAPIREALIDLRVALPDEVASEDLEAAYSHIRNQYPVQKPIHHGRFGIHFDFKAETHKTIQAEQSSLGYRFESEDGKQIVQFRTNGFTFSRLAPYTSWEDVRGEAESLWKVYCDAAVPMRVTRIAARFINEIRIPLPFKDFGEYLTAPPRIPEQLPQALSSYLLRIVLPEPKIGAFAIITQALEEVKPDHAPVILDIDTFINQTPDDDDATIWRRLEDLRNFKNNIFFESITEKALELFK